MPPDHLSTTFAALADPTRRAILARLTSGEASVKELAAPFEMTPPAVTKHLKLLEEVNLVATVKRGREKLHYLNPVPINEIYMRWIGKFEQDRVQALHNLKQAMEKDQ